MSKRKTWNETFLGSTFEGFLPIVVIAFFWFYITGTGEVNAVVLPTPAMVWNTLTTKVLNGTLFSGSTLQEKEKLIQLCFLHQQWCGTH